MYSLAIHLFPLSLVPQWPWRIKKGREQDNKCRNIHGKANEQAAVSVARILIAYSRRQSNLSDEEL